MGESTGSRKRRLELLARQNRGRTVFKTYAEDLARLLKIEIADLNRLDLEATDKVFAAHVKSCEENRHQPQRCLQKTWTYGPTTVWSNVCARTGGALRGINGILFVGPHEYCGAVQAEIERVLQIAPSLIAFDGDTLGLAAIDGCSGLYVDKFEEHSEWFIELLVWGQWSQIIAPAFRG